MFKEAFIMAFIMFLLGGLFSTSMNFAKKVAAKNEGISKYISTSPSLELIQQYENDKRFKELQKSLTRIEESSLKHEKMTNDAIIELKKMTSDEELKTAKKPKVKLSEKKLTLKEKASSTSKEIDNDASNEIANFNW